jgi:hypothetical protein
VDGFLNYLHKDDRLILMKMILDICSYNENVSNVINAQDSQLPIDYFFFPYTLLLAESIKKSNYCKGPDGLSAYIGPIKWILSFIDTIIRKNNSNYSLL